MKLNISEIEAYFSAGDIIPSGGGRTYFKITEILSNRVRIQPTASKTPSRLRYHKLSVVISNIKKVNHKRIEISVGKILSDNKLQDTQNESYLYGMSKEYLKRKSRANKLTDIHIEFDRGVEYSINSTSEERRIRLKKSLKKPKKILASTSVYQRNPDVVAEVLERANGICEQCNSPAPFFRASNKSPYLEVHHKKYLANGGEDTVKNAEALCPNCHREKHFG